MPGFADKLSDEQAAALVNDRGQNRTSQPRRYVRSAERRLRAFCWHRTRATPNGLCCAAHSASYGTNN